MVDRRRFLRSSMGAVVGAELGRFLSLGDLSSPWGPDSGAQSDGVLERRKEYLAVLRRCLRETVPEPEGRRGRVSATAESWEEWLEQTGELPPDFLSTPSLPFLPDPLLEGGVAGGRPIETSEQWERQRNWIRDEYQRWIVGRFPPPPETIAAEVTGTVRSGQTILKDITLRFGPEMRGSLRIQLVLPEISGTLPVFLTNHPLSWPWVNLAVRRGYMGCIFMVGDPMRHGGDDSDPWIDLYPDYDFSAMGRWAWAAMRAVDYLLTLPYVDPERIALAGNSRYAKLDLVAAAFDERITAVVPSRGNCGCGIPWRYTTGMFVNESLEEVTRLHRHWFHPRLRFFTGREDKLPVDQNLLLSLVAPRGLLLSHAYTEHQGNPWAIEQSFRSVRSVYRFLGAEEKLGLLQRPGEHTTVAEVVELYLDFLDGVFERKPFAAPRVVVNGYTYEGWLRTQLGRTPKPPPFRGVSWNADLASGMPLGMVRYRSQRRIAWLMGEKPPAAALEPVADSTVTFRPSDRRRSTTYPRTLFDRPIEAEGMGVATIRYGDDLRVEMYYPANGTEGEPRWQNLPAVLWLHPYAYAQGYDRYTGRAFHTLTEQGFVVLGVDLVGFGTRVEEAADFYLRYPDHSLLGRMVADMRDLVTALEDLELVDSRQVYAVGSGLGGKVGLFLAAMDPRVRGVASVCAFSSLRDAEAATHTEGLRHYSHLHGILPRLGAFVDDPGRTPLDYDEVLFLIAPRPVLVLAPTFDRYHPVESVRSLVERSNAAREAFRVPSALELETPEGFNGFETEWDRELRVIDWVQEKTGR